MNKKGMAIITVIGVMMVLFMLGITFMSKSSMDKKKSNTHLDVFKAKLAAESGIEHAYKELQDSSALSLPHEITILNNIFSDNDITYETVITDMDSSTITTPTNCYIFEKLKDMCFTIGSSNCFVVRSRGECRNKTYNMMAVIYKDTGQTKILYKSHLI